MAKSLIKQIRSFKDMFWTVAEGNDEWYGGSMRQEVKVLPDIDGGLIGELQWAFFAQNNFMRNRRK